MRSMMVAALLTVTVTATACFEPAGPEIIDHPGTQPCEPLASTPPQPLTLGVTLGIGRHADGTIYAMDQIDSGEYRLFASAATILGRKPIAGFSRGQADSGAFYVVSAADPQFTLKIDSTATPTRMGVVRGAFAERDFVIGATGDVLEVQSADAVAALTVLDIPNDVFVEYCAHLPDGRELVVARPKYDWSYEDFRLFLGTPDHMSERGVGSVDRAKDGGSTSISFVLDGGSATAFFPSPLETGAAATLAAGGATLTLALEPPGAAPTGFAFFCL